MTDLDLEAENAKLNRTLGKTQEALENAEGRLDAIHGETPSEVEAKNAALLAEVAKLKAELRDVKAGEAKEEHLAETYRMERNSYQDEWGTEQELRIKAEDERDTLKARIAELGEPCKEHTGLIAHAHELEAENAQLKARVVELEAPPKEYVCPGCVKCDERKAKGLP